MLSDKLVNSKPEPVSRSNPLIATPDKPVIRQHWYNWLIVKPFDWISTPLYIAACLSLVYNREYQGNISEFEGWQIALVIAATLTLLLLDRYEPGRWGSEIPSRVALSYFLMRVGLVGVISWVNPNQATFFMYLIIPFAALLYFGVRAGIGVAIAVWLVFAARVFLFPSAAFPVSQPWPFTNMFTLCLFFIMTTAYSLMREKASRTRSERLLDELAKSQKQVEELAATRERNRLARDIHDSLGHYLTVISVLLGKARAFKEKSPAEADQALVDARRLANEALQDVRASVKSLRSSQELFSLELSLATLVTDLQSGQLTVELTINGSEAGFSKQSLMVLYRVAQEGLTNIQRHAKASNVKVRLDFEPEAAQLALEDNGQGFEPQKLADEQRGYGLRGLQERLEMLGGEFEIESHPGKGTKLVAKVAKNPTSLEETLTTA